MFHTVKSNGKSPGDNRYLEISLFSLSIQFSLFSFYLVSLKYSEFDLPIEQILAQLGIGVSVLLIPDLLCVRWRKSKVASVTVLWLSVLILAGWFSSQFDLAKEMEYAANRTFLAMGVIVLSWYFARLLICVKLSVTLAILFLGSLFGVYIAYVFWGVGYHSPFFTERILLGVANIDTLFHTAIANLFQTYGYPTTGIDGAILIHYHVGSHFVLGSLAGLTNIHVQDFYNLSYPIIFIPLYFKAVLLLTQELIKGTSLTWVSILAFIGIIICWLTLEWPLNRQPFVSESNMLALTVALLLGSILVIHHSTWWIAFVLFILTLSVFSLKISVGAVVAGCLSFLFFRTRGYRKFTILIQYTIYSLLIVFFVWVFIYPSLTSYVASDKSITELLSRVFKYSRPSILLILPVLVFSLYVYLRYQSDSLSKAGEMSNNRIWLAWGSVLVILFLSLIFSSYVWVRPSDALYFLSLNLFLSVPVLLIVFQQILPKEESGYISTMVYGIFTSVIVVLFISRADLIVKRNKWLVDFQEGLNSSLETKKRKDQITLLAELRSLNNRSTKEKRKTVLYIPKSNEIYWKMFKDPSRSEFLAQSLSGIAMIGGQLDSIYLNRVPSASYGFYDYRRDKYINTKDGAIERARILKYKNFVQLDYKEGRISKLELDL